MNEADIVAAALRDAFTVVERSCADPLARPVITLDLTRIKLAVAVELFLRGIMR